MFSDGACISYLCSFHTGSSPVRHHAGLPASTSALGYSVSPCLASYMGARDLNSDPHICRASTVPTKPSPSPSYCLCLCACVGVMALSM